MTKNQSQRRQALKLSVIGAFIVTVFVYGSALIMSNIMRSASDAVDKQRVVPSAHIESDDSSNIGIEIETVEFTENDPYQFYVQSFAFAGTDSLVVEYNNEIGRFVEVIRNEFESDLEFFTGSVQSPDSYLEITALDIRQGSDSIIIDYEIKQFVVGDLEEQTQTRQLVL